MLATRTDFALNNRAIEQFLLEKIDQINHTKEQQDRIWKRIVQNSEYLRKMMGKPSADAEQLVLQAIADAALEAASNAPENAPEAASNAPESASNAPEAASNAPDVPEKARVD